MAKAKIEMNLAGINAVMRSQGVDAVLGKQAELIAGRANSASGGGKYIAFSSPHIWVARHYVNTFGYAGALDNATNNTLAKSIGGG